MDDMFGREAVPLGNFGIPGSASAQRGAFGDELWPGGAVDGPVHAAAAQQRVVCRIHYGVHRKLGDVAPENFDFLFHGRPPRALSIKSRKVFRLTISSSSLSPFGVSSIIGM